MIAQKYLRSLCKRLYNATLTDFDSTQRCFHRDIITNLSFKEDGFKFEYETTAKILKKGIRIYEVPISYLTREYIPIKTIKWSDSLKAGWILIKYRFVD